MIRLGDDRRIGDVGASGLEIWTRRPVCGRTARLAAARCGTPIIRGRGSRGRALGSRICYLDCVATVFGARGDARTGFELAEAIILKHKRNLRPRSRPIPPSATRCQVYCGLIALLAWIGFAAPSFASLGGASATIEADRAHLAARSSTIANAAYTVNVMTLPNGGTVKEFERNDGVVFAITWRGPSRPDLRQLLGSRFDVLQSDVAARTGRRQRGRLSDERSDFVLHGGGHSGAFFGTAYLPQLAPSDFSLSAWQ